MNEELIEYGLGRKKAGCSNSELRQELIDKFDIDFSELKSYMQTIDQKFFESLKPNKKRIKIDWKLIGYAQALVGLAMVLGIYVLVKDIHRSMTIPMGILLSGLVLANKNRRSK